MLLFTTLWGLVSRFCYYLQHFGASCRDFATIYNTLGPRVAILLLFATLWGLVSRIWYYLQHFGVSGDALPQGFHSRVARWSQNEKTSKNELDECGGHGRPQNKSPTSGTATADRCPYTHPSVRTGDTLTRRILRGCENPNSLTTRTDADFQNLTNMFFCFSFPNLHASPKGFAKQKLS